MKKTFEKPELAIILFTNADIITASGDDMGGAGDEPGMEDNS